MSKKIEVKSVEIDIAGSKLKLTPAQARELRDILEETFPSGCKTIPYVPPIIIERDRWRYDPPCPQPWVTWCGSYTTDGTLTVSSTG